MTRVELVASPEDIAAQMARILSSKDFDASDRNRRFLTYIVAEALAGRADRIKAYSIATEVFGRNDDFDPQHDAIVRIEAGRMRRSLDRYYLTSGLNDPVRISVPVGSYVPAFVVHPTSAEAPVLTDEGSPRRPVTAYEPVHRPSVLVRAFVAEGHQAELSELAFGVTRRVSAALARFTDLVVVGSASPKEEVDFVLIGTLAAAGSRIVAEVLLRDTLNGRYIWSDVFDCGSVDDDRMVQRTAIADRIAEAIGQPSGILFSYLAREATNSASATWESFESVVQFHEYWQSFDQSRFEPVRQALEQTIVRDPHYAEAFACLSQLYTNAIRFKYASVAPELHPLQRAISLARTAVRLSPGSSRAYLALGIAFWFDRQVLNALDALEKSYQLNPNDLEVLAELGLRHCSRTDWYRGVPMIEEAYRRNPALPVTHRMGLSMWHFVHGRFHEALVEARNVGMTGVIYPHVMIAVSAHRLGRHEEAMAAVRSILALSPDYGDAVAVDLENRNLHPDLVSALVQGLRDAGLSGRSAGSKMQAGVPVHRPTRLPGKAAR